SAIAEIDPIDFCAEGNRPVELGGNRACRSRLLAWKTKISDEHRVRRVAQVVDLRHAASAPLRIARDEVRDARVALPPVLVRVDEAADHYCYALRHRRVGDVPDFLTAVATRSQQVHLASVRARQITAIAHTHHLRAAGFTLPFLSWDVLEVFRLPRVGHINN